MLVSSYSFQPIKCIIYSLLQPENPPSNFMIGHATTSVTASLSDSTHAQFWCRKDHICAS